MLPLHGLAANIPASKVVLSIDEEPPAFQNVSELVAFCASLVSGGESGEQLYEEFGAPSWTA